MAGEAGSVVTWWAVFSTLGGAIVGSLIGGTTGYLLQMKSLKAAKAQRDEDRFEVRKALGLSLLFKMVRLTSNLVTLGTPLKESLNQAMRAGFVGSPFQIVRPIVPLPDAINFSPEEMALVLSIDTKLFNEMGALDELHNSTVALFDLYGSKRTSTMERFGAKMEGNVGTTMLTEEQKNWLGPRAADLNDLIEAMLQRTEQDGREAWAALEKLQAVVEREFKVKHRLEKSM